VPLSTKMSTDTSLISFKAISTFINELVEVFGEEQHQLKLYARLISKTTIAHDVAIKKHVEAFRKFCTENREAFLKSDASLLSDPFIVYSDNVKIDMKEIFAKADKSTSKVIWKHLLTISAIVDPSGEARRILKESNTQGAETDFLTNIIEKIEEHVDPNANPMEAISSIMASGIFTDLIGGMGNGLQNGTLDIGKLMGTVQKMVTTLTPPSQDGGASGGGMPPLDLQAMMKMMAPPGDGSASAPQVPDLMSMLGPLMSSLNVNANPAPESDVKIEEVDKVD
jgi:hypothetical protein